MLKASKKLVLALIMGILILMGSGCATQNDAEKIEPQTVKVGALSGPTGMGMAPMIVDGVDLGEGVTTEFELATAPDQITSGVINGDFQIAAIPTNVAATLYNKTEGKIVLGAVNTLGTLSIVAGPDENIKSIADLKGKTIAATGQGSTPEYVLSALLTKAGLTPGTDVTINWLAEHAEAAAQLAGGQVSVAMLPEPFATTTLAKNESLVKAVNMTDAWEEAFDGQALEMGCVVVNKEWAEKNPALVKAFMAEYQNAVEVINKADEKAGQYVADAGIIPEAKLAQKAIPNCAIVFISAADGAADLKSYYETLAQLDAKAVGGSVPDETFFGLTY